MNNDFDYIGLIYNEPQRSIVNKENSRNILIINEKEGFWWMENAWLLLTLHPQLQKITRLGNKF